MLRFIVKRIAWTIPVILLVILMTFTMMKLIKGNPFRTTERPVPPAIQANLDRQFNLDKPWYLQYAYYVKDVFTFDLGPSLVQRNRDVNDVIKATFPVSLKLGGLAMLFAIVVGIALLVTGIGLILLAYAVFAREPAVLMPVISESCAIKASVAAIEADARREMKSAVCLRDDVGVIPRR
jgi:ABC-type microcin C transport system permease subunit YejB